jgi:hypothetical protein
VEKLNILIVGDLVIDEYWLLVSHNSEISSHTGFTHYRSDRKRNKILMDLCGAGQIAQIYYQLRNKGSVRYNLFCLGKWSERHQGLINHLVHAKEQRDFMEVIDPYNQPATCCKKQKNLKINITLTSLKPEGPTIRVIRQYQRKGTEIKQINRIDWEPQQQEDYCGNVDLDDPRLKLPQKGQVHAIIIHDLTKGVVTEQLVKNLRDRYPEATWYVRSKNRELIGKNGKKQTIPPWIKVIPKDKLNLLLIAPELSGLHNPWHYWLAKNRMSLQALEVIKHLPGKNVVLLSAQHEVIARTSIASGNKYSGNCITAKSNIKPNELSELNWPSAFFARLTHLMIGKQSIDSKAIEEALSWANNNSGLSLPEVKEQPRNIIRPNIMALRSWETEVKEWEQAFNKLGTIYNNRLEIWRGQTHLPNYIVCIKAKQKTINSIGHVIRLFEKNYNSQRRNLSILLTADPGAGKTSLAKAMAENFGYVFLPYNVTQLHTRDDLIRIFDDIATNQAKYDKPIMVFIDEINAFLGGSHVYSAFLAPLEENHYNRHGTLIELRPCVWIFAGTSMKKDKLARGDKFSDFKSRITIDAKIGYDSLMSKTKENEARLEQVYIGATMIHKHFPDVKQISKAILSEFNKLDPSETPARKMLKWATCLQNVQYGKVSRKNCHNWGKLKWNDEEDLEFIDLDF